MDLAQPGRRRADDPRHAAAQRGGDGRAGSRPCRGRPVVTGAAGAGAEGPAAARRTRRRYPTFTRDTARPEGGRRTAPGDAPAPARQWPLLCVLSLAFAGLAATPVNFRIGLLVLGGAVLGGAVLRATVREVGMLAVRSRFTDIITYGVMGSLIVLLTLMAQPRPWLEIPFLSEILRFSAGT
ncbi:DUF3017 domain-containing protein [Streptomyces alkaliphilus]|uniref:DUF3017 domain-containing protein n=1 Tax=Streptomyces alkaliphilus TaxID=1472722 RepID=A0A7W3THF5_9ACTN|nr:DUF3017 domain-containing protein [Streptomyces alkaliphilus]MBB0246827.1 DUF3017 domain-containing protein [Streptomyces alkaliphilus]MQS07655.1 DUF3017 domain-containing protein [Streptomyces alkaliphilus]